MDTKVTKNYFEFGVHKYFRGDAHLVEIGTYGQKKDPVGAKAYLAPQNKVQRDIVTKYVREGQPVGVNWSQITQAELEANGPIMVFGLNVSVAGTYNYSQTQNAKLKLYNLSIPEGPLQKMLNTEASGARKFLADEGSDSRIVSEVWVVMEAELAEHFTTSGSILISAIGLDINIAAKGGKHGTQTIRLAEGTTFAYALSKVKNWSNNRTHADNLEVDYYGIS